MWAYLKKLCNCFTGATNTSPNNVCSDAAHTTDEYAYMGTDLPCTGIEKGDSFTKVLQKISYKLCSTEFTEQVIESITENINEYPEFITILNNSIDCDTINSCLNTTTTTIQPVSECTTFVRTTQAVYTYDYVNNTFTQRLPNEVMAGFGLAHSAPKLWTMYTNGVINEYDFNFNPFSITFSRTIQNDTNTGLGCINQNTLVGYKNGKIYLIDITTNIASLSEIITLPSIGGLYGTSLTGDILYTSDNKLICIVKALFPGTPTYIVSKILQYDCSDYSLEAMIDLPLNLSSSLGLSVYNNEFYLFSTSVEEGNTLYKIDTSFPYNVTFVNTLSNQVVDASTDSSCINVSFEPNITTSTTTTETPVFCEGNVILNPTFDSSLVNWIVPYGNNWDWSPNFGGTALFMGRDKASEITQNSLVSGQTYNLTFTFYNLGICGQITIVSGGNVYGPFTDPGVTVINQVIVADTSELSFFAADPCEGGLENNLYIDNVCVTLIPSTTTTTIPPTTTSTTTVAPTTTSTTTLLVTTTSTTTVFPGVMKEASISGTSDNTDACLLPFLNTVYIFRNDMLDTPSIGDRLFLDELGTIPFTGDNNFWHITIVTSSVSISARVNSLGFITSSGITLCL